jgi:hypothetical protein
VPPLRQGVNHYCTYFDEGFLPQGLALAASLRRHDPAHTLWVLALDETTASVLEGLRDPQLRVVPLAMLEAADPGLRRARDDRSTVEYYFTLSPCWPLYLLQHYDTVGRITYLDADMFWFSSPQPVLDEMGGASLLLTEHRHPDFLQHHRRFGRFNVGLLSFRQDEVGIAALQLWRERCLEWCRDHVQDGRYADQKYLDEWPERFGLSVRIARRKGANLAPWNWCQYRYQVDRGRVTIDGEPLEVFHFARFRGSLHDRCFQSGQLEYGIMPWGLRQAIYGTYWKSLKAARSRIVALHAGSTLQRRPERGWHQFWRALLPRLVFGSDWLRVGPFFISGRFGLGRFSGRVLAALRAQRGAPSGLAAGAHSKPE